MGMSIRVNSASLMLALERAPGAIEQTVRVGIKEALTEIQREARAVKRYTPRSGMLDRSIQQEVASTGLSGRAFLDTGIAIYGPRIHRGWGTWDSDPFLYKAGRRKKNTTIAIINRAVYDALQRAGLK